MPDGFLIENLLRYIGQTVTIFTTSGGLSGSGFTGVLAAVYDGTVKLITDIGAAPACPVGSCCTGRGFDGWGGNGGWGCGGGSGCNWLGSVTEIPISYTKWNQEWPRRKIPGSRGELDREGLLQQAAVLSAIYV